jgi:hypothetical protein
MNDEYIDAFTKYADISKSHNILGINDNASIWLNLVEEKKLKNRFLCISSDSNITAKINELEEYKCIFSNFKNWSHKEFKSNLSVCFLDLRDSKVHQQNIYLDKINYPCLTWVADDFIMTTEAIVALKAYESLAKKGLLVLWASKKSTEILSPWLAEKSSVRWTFNNGDSLSLISKIECLGTNIISAAKGLSAVEEFKTYINMYSFPIQNKALEDFTGIKKVIEWKNNPKTKLGIKGIYLANNFFKLRFDSEKAAIEWALIYYTNYIKLKLKADWFVVAKSLESLLSVSNYFQSFNKETYFESLGLDFLLDLASEKRLIKLKKELDIYTVGYPDSKSDENAFWVKTVGDKVLDQDKNFYKISYVRYFDEEHPPVFVIQPEQ